MPTIPTVKTKPPKLAKPSKAKLTAFFGAGQSCPVPISLSCTIGVCYTMKENQFFAILASLTAFVWSVDKQTGKIVGKNKHLRGVTFDPVTAVARNQRKGNFSSPHAAADVLGMPNKLKWNLADAISPNKTYDTNRGYPQVLRGRIKTVLNLK